MDISKVNERKFSICKPPHRMGSGEMGEWEEWMSGEQEAEWRKNPLIGGRFGERSGV